MHFCYRFYYYFYNIIILHLVHEHMIYRMNVQVSKSFLANHNWKDHNFNKEKMKRFKVIRVLIMLMWYTLDALKDPGSNGKGVQFRNYKSWACRCTVNGEWIRFLSRCHCVRCSGGDGEWNDVLVRLIHRNGVCRTPCWTKRPDHKRIYIHIFRRPLSALFLSRNNIVENGLAYRSSLLADFFGLPNVLLPINIWICYLKTFFGPCWGNVITNIIYFRFIFEYRKEFLPNFSS